MSRDAFEFYVPAAEQECIRGFRSDTSRTIMRYQIETQGRALVIFLDPEPGQAQFRQVSELPERGKAELYHGETGGGWRYIFHPLLDGGCELAVEFTSCFPAYPLPVEPLRLVLPDDPYRAESIPNPELGGYINFPDPEKKGQPGMRFHISPTYFSVVEEWAAGRPLTQFDFQFTPTTVGTIIKVRHRATKELLDLTKDYEP